VLSPEWVRLVLWHALRERYALPNATTVDVFEVKST
jgi:hypothetical protein